MNRLLKLTTKEFFHKTDQQLREEASPAINIWYGFANYGRDVQHINNIANEIIKDFPNIKYEDMQIWIMARTHTIMHVGQTFLKVSIPVEDFITLRKKNMLEIL